MRQTTGEARTSVHPLGWWRPAKISTTQMTRLVAAVCLSVLIAGVVLTACAPAASQGAEQAKARLDHELQLARTNVGVPDALLQPITAQEQALAASTASDSDQSYQSASAGYESLYKDVVALEKMTPEQVRARTETDLRQLTTAVADIQKQGFVEAPAYAQRLQQAQQQFATAKTARDYFQVDGVATEQTAALQAMRGAYQHMQTLDALVDSQSQLLGAGPATPQPLQCARGSNDSYFAPDPSVTVTLPRTASTYEFQQWPTQDLAQFRAAESAQDYSALASLLQAQTIQLSADQTTLLPQVAQSQVQQFQSAVQRYLQNGGTETSYAQQAAQDAQARASAQTPAAYTSLLTTLRQQQQAFALPSLTLQARHDLATLQQLVNQAQSLKTIDPANNQPYPDGYEYAASGTGIGDAQARLMYAQTADDYQVIDQEIQMLTTNLQAMLQNLNDTTPPDQPHQTDVTLLRHYGIAGTRVMVVSLREQEARFYDNGQLVKALQVTTGNPDLPSPPGVHCVFKTMTNYDDISPFPKGSQYYYNPTHINYGMVYSDYGYIVHDAWWRSWFGKYSNLPHHEPIAFNNGSHGCINLSLPDMQWVYNWMRMGTPVLVY